MMDLSALPLQPPAPLASDATDSQRAIHANASRAFSELALAVAMSEAAAATLKQAEAHQAIAAAMAAPEPVHTVSRAALARQLVLALAGESGADGRNGALMERIGDLIEDLSHAFPGATAA